MVNNYKVTLIISEKETQTMSKVLHDAGLTVHKVADGYACKPKDEVVSKPMND